MADSVPARLNLAAWLLDHHLDAARAFVRLHDGHAPSLALAAALQAHVRTRTAPYQYPRWIEFVPELPRTATGKVQRFKLRTPSGD